MNHTMQNNSTYSDIELEKRREFDRSRPIERDEKKDLISSDRVDGTKVFSTDGDEIGTVSRVMIGKRSGRVEFVEMSFGGFLGIGEKYHALPWDALDYDTDRGGYVVNIDKSRLKDAPNYKRGEEPSFDRTYGESVYQYYGVIY